MRELTFESPTHFHHLRCADSVEFLDKETIEVDAPDWLEGGRMKVDALMVEDLISCEDTDGLAEIGIEVIASVSRASLN